MRKKKAARPTPIKHEQGKVDFTEQILAAALGWKYAPTRYTGPPKIGIKKQGKIHMNRASADAFLEHGFKRVLLLRSNDKLFIVGERDPNNSSASAITFDKGGVPAMITGKVSLRHLKIRTDENWTALPAQIWQPEKEASNEKIRLGPNDVVLVVDLPKEIFDDRR